MLPTCERIHHRFNYRSAQVKDVIYFAHSHVTSGETTTNNSIDQACLSDSSIPIVVYHNHSQTLLEAGLTKNTLLHFSYCQ